MEYGFIIRIVIICVIICVGIGLTYLNITSKDDDVEVKEESISEKRKSDYYKVDNGMYVFLYNYVENTVYDFQHNLFLEVELLKRVEEIILLFEYSRFNYGAKGHAHYRFYRNHYIIKGLSKEEYESTINNLIPCNCEIGAGSPDIRYGQLYNILKYFKEHYSEEFDVVNTWSSDKTNKTESFSFCYNDYPEIVETIEFVYYHKKACLKCNTCLDEKKDMIRHISIYIENLNKRIEEFNKIEEICGE